MEHLLQLKIWKIEHLLLGANAPISMILSKVVKTLLRFFLIFFQYCPKIENDVMILKKGYGVKGQVFE